MEANEGITLNIQHNEWKPLSGNPSVAYGLKCTIGDLAKTLENSAVELILALETTSIDAIPTGYMSLPSLKIKQFNRTNVQL